MKKSYTVVHCEHISERPFNEVVEIFEGATGIVEDFGFTALAANANTQKEFEAVIHSREGSSGFVRFLTLNHGGWMNKYEGSHSSSILYTIGNPLIARTMLKHEVGADSMFPSESTSTLTPDAKRASLMTCPHRSCRCLKTRKFAKRRKNWMRNWKPWQRWQQVQQLESECALRARELLLCGFNGASRSHLLIPSHSKSQNENTLDLRFPYQRIFHAENESAETHGPG